MQNQLKLEILKDCFSRTPRVFASFSIYFYRRLKCPHCVSATNAITHTMHVRHQTYWYCTDIIIIIIIIIIVAMYKQDW